MSKYNREEIGKRIKNKRRELNLTQEELAHKVKLSSKQISKYENSDGYKNLPTFDNMLNIREVLNCDIGYLLGEKGYEAGTKEETIVQDFTGLSHEAICAIRKISDKGKEHTLPFKYESKKSNTILNRLLSSPVFIEVIKQLMDLDRIIGDYKDIEENAKKEVGQDAWDEAPELEKSLERPLYAYDDNEDLGLTDNQIRAIQLHEEIIDKRIDYGFRAKVLRYSLHETIEHLVDDLYPRLYEEQNSI